MQLAELIVAPSDEDPVTTVRRVLTESSMDVNVTDEVGESRDRSGESNSASQRGFVYGLGPLENLVPDPGAKPENVNEARKFSVRNAIFIYSHLRVLIAFITKKCVHYDKKVSLSKCP